MSKASLTAEGRGGGWWVVGRWLSGIMEAPLPLCLCVCMYKHVQVQLCWYKYSCQCGGQRTTFTLRVTCCIYSACEVVKYAIYTIILAYTLAQNELLNSARLSINVFLVQAMTIFSGKVLARL